MLASVQTVGLNAFLEKYSMNWSDSQKNWSSWLGKKMEDRSTSFLQFS